ncbi:MAG TPA: hypothetical protein VK539_03115 [Myxococcaceae bacterium]|nr:hypothetical protein [Myxococcaceae bacterium]
MPIDDSNTLLTIGANGTVIIPNANAVAFSLVPLLGKFPVKVVLDNDEAGALVVDSPRYQAPGLAFTKLEIREAQPFSTFKLRLLTDGAAGELGRSRHSAAGHLSTEPAGAVPLFDIDTRNDSGRLAWRRLQEKMMAFDSGGTQEQLFQVVPAAPFEFTRGTIPPVAPNDYYNGIVEPGPTWNVSAARELVFGIEMWGDATDDSGEREHLPAWTLIKPSLHLVDAENGATIEGALTMGSNGDFAAGLNEVIPYTGKHGVVSTGSLSPTVTTFIRRIAKRARFARFELLLKGGDQQSLSSFGSCRPFLRLFAYAQV